MENKKERAKSLYKYLKYNGLVSTQDDLAKKIKYNRVSVAKALNGYEDYLTCDFANAINTTFGNIIDIDWLLYGEGEMLKSDTSVSKDEAVQVEEVKGTVLLLPVSAQGGSLNDFVMSVKESDCERIISPIKGADFAMSVAGDSMAPEYPSGSQILIKKINERAFIDWGRVYVLDTCNGSVIKKIMPSEDGDAGKVRCVSINPDYPPFHVSFEDIYGMYRVLLCMSVK